MSTEDFFSKLDEKLKAAQEKEVLKKATMEKNLSFLKEVSSRLSPLAKDYKSKLQERGIKVDLKISDYCISFSLTYRDGGHHAITLGAALNSNRLEITENFTDDDGRNYTSLDGSSYDSANWKDEIYEEKLKKSIESFISYADRHGGI
ncbi:hypothetical protein AAER06_29860 [Pseudomonas aeruginosa]|uniref:hypothetical protein n=4 Tax=Pseudomonas aeruginosa TaxID=287 RepID=UPI000B33B34F|nr:hypothetical protein [Pseudomonas aeruginosa]MBG4300922.1 hypothetical protein [Pseudomonas aeruginosa]MBH8256420.1 hypothetical protein [Pseudomonas aeruginosa]MBH8758487.1 hypothetical protein [Pseudomonas aeruginosa]MBX5851647.1 hypothetical protein [Pseudomonas aeruginosa]MBX6796209.1 hypothetical protein [Pseudomonas aeruginosa]